MRILFLLGLSIFCMAGWAADGSVATRSASLYLADKSDSLAQKINDQPVIETIAQSKPRLIQGARTNETEFRVAGHSPAAEFEFFDAWVQLSGDLDADGYFHRLNVVFDADTTASLETVYVKLYLSKEGGDWYQYATSELFEIHYDSVDDTYEVVSELVEGYLPGQYDVLIELHSLFHPGIVASRVVDADEDGYVITLEDLQHDEAARHVIVDDGYVYGTGSFSALSLVMLLILGVMKSHLPGKRSI